MYIIEIKGFITACGYQTVDVILKGTLWKVGDISADIRLIGDYILIYLVLVVLLESAKIYYEYP